MTVNDIARQALTKAALQKPGDSQVKAVQWLRS